MSQRFIAITTAGMAGSRAAFARALDGASGVVTEGDKVVVDSDEGRAAFFRAVDVGIRAEAAQRDVAYQKAARLFFAANEDLHRQYLDLAPPAHAQEAS